MAGLRQGFRWSTTGIGAKLGSDLESALRYLKDVHGFSVAVAEFLRSVGNVELLQGQLHEVTTDGTTAANYAPHSLGRPYVGVLVLGQAPSSVQAPRTILPSELQQNGRDPAKEFGFRVSAGAPVTLRLWVF